MADAPALSVIVVISSDTLGDRANVSHLEGCLEALSRQQDPPAMEIIVPHHQSVDGIDDLSKRFPAVVFQPVPDVSIADRVGGGREHHDELRSHGLNLATGKVVALLEDYARPDRLWATSIMVAHDHSCAAVGGAIENGIDRSLNWAVYFCDFGKYQNPLPAGPAAFASDINTSYKRSALDGIRHIWSDSFREILVNGALIGAGGLVHDPKIIVHHHRADLGLSFALRERFIWGRSYAGTRRMIIGDAQRYLFAVLSLGLPVLLLARMAVTARTRRRHFPAFVRALPHLVPLLICWSMGEMIGYLEPQRLRA